jgi:hypothetical protein
MLNLEKIVLDQDIIWQNTCRFSIVSMILMQPFYGLGAGAGGMA